MKARPLLRAVLAIHALLALFAIALPGVWFRAFHDTFAIDPFGFLRSCGAGWLGIAILTAIALIRKESFWLAVVAGGLLAGAQSNLAYLAFAQQSTHFAKGFLPLLGIFNLGSGIYLLKTYTQ
jgi:hypothetical protein